MQTILLQPVPGAPQKEPRCGLDHFDGINVVCRGGRFASRFLAFHGLTIEENSGRPPSGRHLCTHSISCGICGAQ